MPRTRWPKTRWRRRRLHKSRAWLALAALQRSVVASTAAMLAVALGAGWYTASLVHAAQSTARRFGATATVLVTRTSVDAGHTISAADVVRKRMPRALLPDAVVARRAVGRVAVVDLAAGEIVLDERLATSSVPAGWRAIAIDAPHPELRTGDAVEILDVGIESGAVIATEARVIDVDDDGTITVAVPSGDVAAVAYAAAGGTATIAVIAPRLPR